MKFTIQERHAALSAIVPPEHLADEHDFQGCALCQELLELRNCRLVIESHGVQALRMRFGKLDSREDYAERFALDLLRERPILKPGEYEARITHGIETFPGWQIEARVWYPDREDDAKSGIQGFPIRIVVPT